MYSSTVCNIDFIFYWFFLKTGLEIIEQVPDVEAVVIPVGGGGLIAGCAVALKTMKPNIRIIVSLLNFWLIHKTTVNWHRI